MAVKTYEDSGVILSKKTLYSGDRLKINYNGLLAQAGAENVYLHSGYGSDWSNSSYIQMQKTQDGFSAELEVLEGHTLELCFKDSADNWDNNSGNNYLFNISAKKEKKTEAVKAAKGKTEKAKKAGTKGTEKKEEPKSKGPNSTDAKSKETKSKETKSKESKSKETKVKPADKKQKTVQF